MGGYDDGYRACPCFWGREPGSLVRLFADETSGIGKRALDLGCGEGKNAAFLAMRAWAVVAVDRSEEALANARLAWPEARVQFLRGDATVMEFDGVFDLVILYGFLHCLADEHAVLMAIRSAQAATGSGGYNIVCTFNNRAHCSLALAHPGFSPCLLSHDFYIKAYGGWNLSNVHDRDLEEVHPHNGIRHSHSMTRFIARRPT